MGAKPSVKVSTDVASSTEPGKKVCSTEPLEVDPNALFEELLDQLRYPVDSMAEYVLKSCDVEEHGADDFTVKVVLDGKKLDRYRHGRGDGMDMITSWTRITADRARRRIESRCVVPPPHCWADEVDKVQPGAYGVWEIVGSPLRVEFHCGSTERERHSDDRAKGGLEYHIPPALANLSKRKVKVLAEQDSLCHSGQKSVLSEPMDGHTDFDAFWAKFLEMVRQPANVPVRPKVVEVSKSEFHTIVEVPGESGSKQVTTKVKHNQGTGEIMTETVQDGETIARSTVVLHKQPLRVESWALDAEGKRWASRGTAKSLQEYVDAVLAKRSHRSWFSR